eukprot:gene2673-3316_t
MATSKITPTTKHLAEVFGDLIKSNNKGTNFLDVCFSLPNRGVGHRICKKNWPEPNTYWTVTKVKFSERQVTSSKRGKAYGFLTWNGKTDLKERRVIDQLDKVWTPFPYVKPVVKEEVSNVEQQQEQEQQS